MFVLIPIPRTQNAVRETKCDETAYTRRPDVEVQRLVVPTVRRMKTKLALMGESEVGKTSLIRRFVLKEYEDTDLRTVGTRVSKVELEVPYGADVEVKMDMSIFEIMGERGCKDPVRATYYHAAQGLMAVPDSTRKESISALIEWIPSSLEITGEVPLYIVVNKKDLEDRRAITDEEVRSSAESFRAPYVYTSAVTGEFVEDAFHSLAIEMVDRAFRRDQARAIERGLREKILVLLAKRGPIGLKKNQFVEILLDVRFNDLEAELGRLEGEGLLTIMWSGAADFTAVITPQGSKASIEASGWEEE